jgi:hypothetical protein
MKETLSANRPPICCEVLHRDALFPRDQYAEHLHDLEKLLAALDYRILHIQSYPPGARYRLSTVNEFPRAEFTAQSYDECDYLFLPKEMPVPLGGVLMEESSTSGG